MKPTSDFSFLLEELPLFLSSLLNSFNLLFLFFPLIFEELPITGDLLLSLCWRASYRELHQMVIIPFSSRVACSFSTLSVSSFCCQ